ncbi:hypothetical protein NL676_007573 [Syzygium grande]|nr:hypothetical protein NL676_007573 [Syzygium grande]
MGLFFSPARPGPHRILLPHSNTCALSPSAKRIFSLNVSSHSSREPSTNKSNRNDGNRLQNLDPNPKLDVDRANSDFLPFESRNPSGSSSSPKITSSRLLLQFFPVGFRG